MVGVGLSQTLPLRILLVRTSKPDDGVVHLTDLTTAGHGNAYSLDIDSAWSGMTPVSGNGVQLNGITFSNWKGTEANGAQRGPIKVLCANGAPCTGVTIENFAMWTETGSSQTYTCQSAYGSGSCLHSGTGGSYSAVTTTVTSAPSGYQAATMPDDLQSSFGTTQYIPIPAIPASFYPGTSPLKPLAGSGGGSSSSSTTTTSRTSTTTSTSPSGCTAAHYDQCGGIGWTGCTKCASPYTCQVSNSYYSQCL
jgi:rhamnogalacturonan hydrolase